MIIKSKDIVMKKFIYAAMLLLGVSMMVSCGNGQGKTENKETVDTENQVQQTTPTVEEEAEPADTRPHVYANAFDGFVNIRETAQAKAPILGVFRNGPEGAALLSTEGEWTQVDCNGIVGYVLSKYVQDTPTVAYIGTATLDDIAGLYYSPGGYGMYLWYDGTWESGYNDPVNNGIYILQNNEVKLIPAGYVDINTFEWIDYDDATSESKSEILPIDLAHHKLGDWKRQPFITKQEIEKWIKENREEFSYEIQEHGEKWFKDNALNFMREGGGSFNPMTKEEFKRKGH